VSAAEAREAAEARLRQEYAETAERLRASTADFEAMVEASAGSNADDEHDPEGATIAFERSQLAAVVGQLRTRLADVEAALIRVEDGSYAVCESCGGPIAAERLEARPTARTCIRCASRSGV
jgi:RNA polymerase-binding transcription factor DksA